MNPPFPAQSEESLDENRRQYFRSEGELYLHVSREGDVKHDIETYPAISAQREVLDPIEIKLMHFRAQLSYQDVELAEHFNKLADIVEDIHHYVFKAKHGQGALPKIEKKRVIISGAGLSFSSPESYQSGDILHVSIAFPAYPYEIIALCAEVVQCHVESPDVTPSQVPIYHTSCSYIDILESDRELIIKYVNHLERECILKDRGTPTSLTPTPED